jgi:hypothetical protein
LREYKDLLGRQARQGPLDRLGRLDLRDPLDPLEAEARIH